MRSASRLWAAWRIQTTHLRWNGSGGRTAGLSGSSQGPRVPGLEKNMFKIILDTTMYIYIYMYLYIYISENELIRQQPLIWRGTH